MNRRLVCINNKICERYITIGKVYDVTIRENGNISFINDYGEDDIFHGDMLHVYFMDIEVHRGNVIDNILE